MDETKNREVARIRKVVRGVLIGAHHQYGSLGKEELDPTAHRIATQIHAVFGEDQKRLEKALRLETENKRLRKELKRRRDAEKKKGNTGAPSGGQIRDPRTVSERRRFLESTPSAPRKS